MHMNCYFYFNQLVQLHNTILQQKLNSNFHFNSTEAKDELGFGIRTDVSFWKHKIIVFCRLLWYRDDPSRSH